MFSLNAPVPGAVSALAWELRSQFTPFDVLRDEHSLVIKRLTARDGASFHEESKEVRAAVSGTAPFEVAITGIDWFSNPPAGPAPVIYFDVESPALFELHMQLVDALGAVSDIEGEPYQPHVTVARGGGDAELLERLREIQFEPVHWSVDRLIFWDTKRELPVGEISLPA